MKITAIWVQVNINCLYSVLGLNSEYEWDEYIVQEGNVYSWSHVCSFFINIKNLASALLPHYKCAEWLNRIVTS